MEFTYRKVNNKCLFEKVKKSNMLNLEEPQSYNPLYSRFFEMTEKNSELISLNNALTLADVECMNTMNAGKAKVVSENGKETIKDVFFKFSPLLDPSKYMIGRYDVSDTDLLSLPVFGSEKGHAKVRDPNNSAYVDSFFTYLTSQMLHRHNFPHALDFYGSFLAKKNDFRIDICDDLEYLNDSKFFHENRGTLFKVEDGAANALNFDSRKNKDRIVMDNEDLGTDILQLSDIEDLTALDKIFTNGNMNVSTKNADLVFSFDLSRNLQKKEEDASSSCSSRSSITNNETDIQEHDHDEEDIEYEETDSLSSASEDELMATIKSFPVQVIALEKCYDTLDKLIVEQGHDFTDEEWGSMAAQVVMMLLVYQKSFEFTHNDLHTNNIMFIKTEKQFLNYKIGGKYYKIPTYGRIYKLIDFGRAIYKFRGNVICSDSYHSKGDAATQYNFEPYFNEKKPRLEPNLSFDLCRLGCSLYDFIVDDIEMSPKSPKTAARRMIAKWCNDDKGRNMLYKTNGEERYPDFKLYKMIARSVHNHTPENVLASGYFNRFIVSKKKLSKRVTIIDIDSLPVYT
jgi:hypothetical protein